MFQPIAIGYGRTSNESANDNKISVDVQKDDFFEACKKHGLKGLWFEDRGISGRVYNTDSPMISLDKVTEKEVSNKPRKERTRQGLADAFKAAKEHKAIMFWVRNTDRLLRPLSGSYLASYILSVLDELNIKLFSLEEGGYIDFTNHTTRLMFGITNEIKDNDIKKKSANSIQTITRKRNEGLLYTDPECLGFRSSGKGKVSAVESELAVVKRIFKAYLSGQSIRQITIALNTDHIPAFAASIWGRKTITNILKRAWYAGLQPDSHGNLIESKVFGPYAVVTKADFLKAQARLSKNTSAGQKRESKFYRPLEGLVRCGSCGALMYPVITNYNRATPQYYYRCKNNHHATVDTSKLCNASLIRETYGIPALVGQSKGYLSQPSEGNKVGLVELVYPFLIPALIQHQKAKDTTPELTAKIEAVKAAIQAIKAKTVQRYKDLESGFLDRDAYATLDQASKAETAKLTQDLAALAAQINQQAVTKAITIKAIKDLATITASDYATLIRTVIRRIDVHQDKIAITLTEAMQWQHPVITIPRIPCGNQRYLPKPAIMLTEDGKEICISYPIPSKPPVTVWIEA